MENKTLQEENEELRALLVEARRVFMAVEGWEDLLDEEQDALLVRIDAALSNHKGKA